MSFVCSLIAFVALLGESPDERAHSSTLWTWLSAGDLEFGAEILVDPLSVFMMLVVSGVGFLILSYAVGYMHGDPEERRYHAYKALFVFSMLLLVQSGNLLLLLAGWGMVGLSSYLLINFWHVRATRGRGRQEGVHHERVRRRDLRARALPAHPASGIARLPRGLPGGRSPRSRRRSRC